MVCVAERAHAYPAGGANRLYMSCFFIVVSGGRVLGQTCGGINAVSGREAVCSLLGSVLCSVLAVGVGEEWSASAEDGMHSVHVH